jgi:hypothetical protein
LLIDRENLVEGDKDGVEIVNCADFFFINYIDRGAEDFAENDKIKDNKNDIETADYEKFFLNYTDRCAVSLHSANLVIAIAATKTASIYRF